MRKKQNKWYLWMTAAAVLLLSTAFYVFPAWAEEGGQENWGQADPGWQKKDHNWYFLYPLPGDGFGKPVIGWQWIDGYCYYFLETGKLAVSVRTPDGFSVSETGAWVVEETPVFIPGKGILSNPLVVDSRDVMPVGGGGKTSGGGSGGGGSGGGGGTSGSANPLPPSLPEQDTQLPETKPEGEPEHDEELRLHHWQTLARQADWEITQIHNDYQEDYMVLGSEENDRRIKNLVSMISDDQWHEFYMIGVNYHADTLILGQTFGDKVRYSHTILDVLSLENIVYTISRIRVQKISMEQEEQEDQNPSEGRHYSYGDSLLRTIGQQEYRFRCIEEDYQDASGNYHGLALFLCDTVIRADVDSQETQNPLLSFGENNNYKNSAVRRWLLKNTKELPGSGKKVSCGVNQAFEGMTEDGDFAQFDETLLDGQEILYQKLQDEIFLLSVEEAVAYRKELWRFEGSLEENPETQYSSHSKGYYLRTPKYQEENDEFCYGNEVYMVDLLTGSIHPVDVTYSTIGIRPAFVLVNG